MASDLMGYLGEVSRECRDDPVASSSDNALSFDDSQPKSNYKLDGHYIDKLHDFVKALKQEPGVDGQFYNNTGHVGMTSSIVGNHYRY